jgi:hypothetical protein
MGELWEELGTVSLEGECVKTIRTSFCPISLEPFQLATAGDLSSAL